MRISIGMISEVPVVRVEGEVDPDGAGSLRKAVLDVMGRDGIQVIMDLEDCTYIDSAGLSVLFSPWSVGPARREEEWQRCGPPCRSSIFSSW